MQTLLIQSRMFAMGVLILHSHQADPIGLVVVVSKKINPASGHHGPRMLGELYRLPGVITKVLSDLAIHIIDRKKRVSLCSWSLGIIELMDHFVFSKRVVSHSLLIGFMLISPESDRLLKSFLFIEILYLIQGSQC